LPKKKLEKKENLLKPSENYELILEASPGAQPTTADTKIKGDLLTTSSGSGYLPECPGVAEDRRRCAVELPDSVFSRVSIFLLAKNDLSGYVWLTRNVRPRWRYTLSTPDAT